MNTTVYDPTNPSAVAQTKKRVEQNTNRVKHYIHPASKYIGRMPCYFSYNLGTGSTGAANVPYNDESDLHTRIKSKAMDLAAEREEAKIALKVKVDALKKSGSSTSSLNKYKTKLDDLNKEDVIAFRHIVVGTWRNDYEYEAGKPPVLGYHDTAELRVFDSVEAVEATNDQVQPVETQDGTVLHKWVILEV